jgi:glyoxylate/hydroxypyruvate reductase A
MGQATAKQLLALGYQVSGWSRTSSSHSQCTAAGMACYAGQQQLEAFVRAQDVLVCLLPLTEETTGGGWLNCHLLLKSHLFFAQDGG